MIEKYKDKYIIALRLIDGVTLIGTHNKIYGPTVSVEVTCHDFENDNINNKRTSYVFINNYIEISTQELSKTATQRGVTIPKLALELYKQAVSGTVETINQHDPKMDRRVFNEFIVQRYLLDINNEKK